MPKSPDIQIQPQSGMIDDPLSIKIDGLETDSNITIRCETVDESGLSWLYTGKYRADRSGIVNIADAASITLLMRPAGYGKHDLVPGFLKRSIEPLKFEFSVEANGGILERAVFYRCLISDGNIFRQQVSEDGLVGALFYPKDEGPHPVIIVLGGTDGGLSEARGSFPASHGYAVLSLAYFGIDPLPKSLAEIPLEYLEKA
ncbi:MAG: acyl-CoA thioesterase/BAAT N-terminal domain-containing protein, partial [bacterium]